MKTAANTNPATADNGYNRNEITLLGPYIPVGVV